MQKEEIDMKKKEIYGTILKNVQIIKQGIMTELADELPFGITNTAAVSELESLADINGIVMKELHKQGETYLPVDGKPQFVAMEVNGERYISHISKVEEVDVQTKAKDIPPVREEVLPKREETPVAPVPMPIPVPAPVKDTTLAATESYDFVPSVEETASVEESIPEENSMPVETPVSEESTEETTPMENTTPVEEPVDMDETVAMPEQSPVEDEVQKIPQIPAPQIIGEITSLPNINSMQKAEIFTEEKEKSIDEFVYDIRRIMVSHMGSAPEEMQFFIAPLKIYKYSCTAAPIVVSVYYRGRYYNFSSYDKIEDGRNMVSAEINEYYFLIRGFFDEKGRFCSTIQTTGISANQNDRINVISSDAHHPTGPAVGNGHLKFRFNGDDGTGIIEVFPREPGEDEYLLVVRYGEFLDYPIISKSPGGIQKYRLVNDGMNSELICVWNGDILSAEIVPV